MKQNSKSYKLYLVLIALALLFLLGVNSTYAYFSAKGEKEGTNSLATLEVYWHSSKYGANLEATDGVITITPSVTEISRGGSFGFNHGTYTDDTIGFQVVGAGAYIRFWVEVYVDEDTSNTNYGQYFELQFKDGATGTNGYISSKLNTDTTSNTPNTIYYYDEAIGTTGTYDDSGLANSPVSNDFITGMKLSENTPIDILSSSVTITIHFEAVQSANGAYKSVFGTTNSSGVFTPDWKGVSEFWG